MTPRDDAMRRAVEAASKFVDALDLAARSGRDAIAAFTAVVESSSTETTDERDLWEIDDIIERFPVSRRMVRAARSKGLLAGHAPAGSNRIMFEPKAVEEWVRGRATRSSLRVVR